MLESRLSYEDVLSNGRRMKEIREEYMSLMNESKNVDPVLMVDWENHGFHAGKYYEAGFTEFQLLRLYEGFTAGIDFTLYANKKFSEAKMNLMKIALIKGISRERVLKLGKIENLPCIQDKIRKWELNTSILQKLKMSVRKSA